ncbi:tRNA pseudouridine(55) synthase TruB [Rickettsiella grylli]|uniref:tRNA pseudouridine(55) synthase TruB n=1 Tax=Rickettsiella grylli TaxID=59196 RepID=UPI0008FD2FDE|nr:tRNA pseudouridine(55) synthase TruB [Rickettsiella grylli]OIZ99068.1 tRNA pseudouridine(55) synthase TruB [Rickettsiella grylli]
MQALRSKKRAITGILLLDKPKGMTSNQALQKVKQLFLADKIGHTGSLDPLATGLLPLCLGEATKFSQFLLNADKRYVVSARLGIKTNTGDAEGEVIKSCPIADYSLDELEAILSHFRGSILQTPPMFSALKYKGQPLYKLARQGIVVERRPRTVKIHCLHLLESNEDKSVLSLEIKCSKGTYIRTLIEDIGESLGCGAYVQNLRRLGVANYCADQMVSLDELQALSQNERYEKLLNLDSLLSEWPIFKVSQAAAYYLYCGRTLLLPNLPKQGLLRLCLKENDRFIGIGEILENGRVMPRRLIDFNKSGF